MLGLIKTGDVKLKTTLEIDHSRIGIGLEKLDRNLYDPSRCYDYLTELGAKRARIQSGWCRTEKEKGVYDFAWLDSIVDNLISRGIEPWMCLCYGNELYTEGAVNAAGSVGRPPIKTEAERAAWDRYVEACVKRYAGRVELYEIWNEPDGGWCWRPEPNPVEYRDFAYRTALAIRRADPSAKIAAGSFCGDIKYLYEFLDKRLAEQIDYITYHRYRPDVENGIPEFVAKIGAAARALNPNIRVIQGETGAQSRFSRRGALKDAEWTQRKQAKFLLRKLMIDLTTDVLFTSYFSAVDIFENIANDYVNVTESYYGFFGVLGEEFDETGKPLGKYFKKDSFRAMRVLCSIFGGDFKNEELHIIPRKNYSGAVWQDDEDFNDPAAKIYKQGFSKPNGSFAFAYWKATNILTTDFASTVSLTCCDLGGDVKLVDLYTGEIYAIDDEHMSYENGVLELKNIPIKDYPLLLTFGDFAETDK